VHAILVVDDRSGRPLGWATSRGLLHWVDRDIALSSARDAVTEPPLAIEPSARAREALELLHGKDASRLLVVRGDDGLPEGVVAEVDLLRLVAR
jgi:CBS domain-containing protein